MAERKKKAGLYRKLRYKYRIQIMSEENFEEKASWRLSPMNVFVIVGATLMLMIVFTIYLVAFTSLREYIPGYADTSSRKKLNQLLIVSDSLDRQVRANQVFLQNLQNVLTGGPAQDYVDIKDSTRDYSDLRNAKTKEDSALRMYVEKQDQYNLPTQKTAIERSIGNVLFFTPLRGQVTEHFDKSKAHFGVDVVTRKNEAVKAVLDGTVLIATWTSETGHILVLQHAGNIVSVYKHNAVLLKKTGAYVRAGEPIAIVGNSGEYTTGPHLHFELWYNGVPMNPEAFMVF